MATFGLSRRIDVVADPGPGPGAYSIASTLSTGRPTLDGRDLPLSSTTMRRAIAQGATTRRQEAAAAASGANEPMYDGFDDSGAAGHGAPPRSLAESRRLRLAAAAAAANAANANNSSRRSGARSSSRPHTRRGTARSSSSSAVAAGAGTRPGTHGGDRGGFGGSSTLAAAPTDVSDPSTRAAWLWLKPSEEPGPVLTTSRTVQPEPGAYSLRFTQTEPRAPQHQFGSERRFTGFFISEEQLKHTPGAAGPGPKYALPSTTVDKHRTAPHPSFKPHFKDDLARKIAEDRRIRSLSLTGPGSYDHADFGSDWARVDGGAPRTSLGPGFVSAPERKRALRRAATGAPPVSAALAAAAANAAAATANASAAALGSGSAAQSGGSGSGAGAAASGAGSGAGSGSGTGAGASGVSHQQQNEAAEAAAARAASRGRGYRSVGYGGGAGDEEEGDAAQQTRLRVAREEAAASLHFTARTGLSARFPPVEAQPFISYKHSRAARLGTQGPGPKYLPLNGTIAETVRPLSSPPVRPFTPNATARPATSAGSGAESARPATATAAALAAVRAPAPLDRSGWLTARNVRTRGYDSTTGVMTVPLPGTAAASDVKRCVVDSNCAPAPNSYALPQGFPESDRARRQREAGERIRRRQTASANANASAAAAAAAATNPNSGSGSGGARVRGATPGPGLGRRDSYSGGAAFSASASTSTSASASASASVSALVRGSAAPSPAAPAGARAAQPQQLAQPQQAQSQHQQQRQQGQQGDAAAPAKEQPEQHHSHPSAAEAAAAASLQRAVARIVKSIGDPLSGNTTANNGDNVSSRPQTAAAAGDVGSSRGASRGGQRAAAAAAEAAARQQRERAAAADAAGARWGWGQ